MSSSPSRHKPCAARITPRRCLSALCLGLALLSAAPPASAASLHEFMARWGKTTVSSWPPPEESATVPSVNGTRSTVVPAPEDTRQPAAGSGTNATVPAAEPHTATPAATTDQGQAMRGTMNNAATPAAGETHKPATESARNAAASAQTEAPRSQPPAHPIPETRQSVALPDGMPSSLLGNGSLHAPTAPPPAQQ